MGETIKKKVNNNRTTALERTAADAPVSSQALYHWATALT